MFQLFWSPYDKGGNTIRVARKEYDSACQTIERIGGSEIPLLLKSMKQMGRSLDDAESKGDKFSVKTHERQLENARLNLNEMLTRYIRESVKMVWFEHVSDPDHSDPLEGYIVKRMLDMGRFQGFEGNLESIERILQFD